MLISGTHVGSRVWRDSHNDCSRGIAVVCPIWTWTLQEPSKCLQPTAERAPARVRALVVRWCCWTGGVPAGSQPAGERQGEEKNREFVFLNNFLCWANGYFLIIRNAGSLEKAAWELGRRIWSLKRSSTPQELWSSGARAVGTKPLVCTRPSQSTAQCSRLVTECCA